MIRILAAGLVLLSLTGAAAAETPADQQACNYLADQLAEAAENKAMDDNQIAEVGGLRSGLDLDRATEIAAVLMDPMPYQRLVTEAHWSMEEYVALIARMAGAALLLR